MKIRKLTKTEVKICIGVGAGLLIGTCYKLTRSNDNTMDADVEEIVNFIQKLMDEKRLVCKLEVA